MIGWDGRWLWPGCAPGMFLQKWFCQKTGHRVCHMTCHCFVKPHQLIGSFPRHSLRRWRKRHEEADDRWVSKPWFMEKSVFEWSLLLILFPLKLKFRTVGGKKEKRMRGDWRIKEKSRAGASRLDWWGVKMVCASVTEGLTMIEREMKESMLESTIASSVSNIRLHVSGMIFSF